ITAIYTGEPGHEPSRNTDLVNITPPNGGHPTTTSLECLPANVVVGNAATCTATVTDTDPADPGNPTRAVVFASDSAGTFNLGGCQLKNLNADKATCDFTYTPSAVRSGTHTISAAYEGDADHEPSPVVSDEVTVTGVNSPPPPPPGTPTGPGTTPPVVTPPAPGPLAPNTILRKKPRKKTAKRKAKFKFVADQPGSTFQCKLDKKPFKPCRSPWKKKIKAGRHTFRVRAINPQGMVDPTPAIFKWKVGKAKKR
ncbi:MAG: Ig-like domain-containing protein, partial [Solirubrobacterales bacterium]